MTTTDSVRAIRAVSHVLGPNRVEWQGYGVNDVLIARIMLAIEDRVEFRRAANGRWYGPDGDRLSPYPVSTAINEMIRVGLLINHPYGTLIPAKVHLAAPGGVSWCAEPGEGGVKRVRLAQDPIAVDCLACLEFAWAALL